MSNPDQALLDAYIFMRFVKVYCIISLMLVITFVAKSIIEVAGRAFAIFFVICISSAFVGGVVIVVWNRIKERFG